MKLSLVVAANQKDVIGADNKLLWHLPEDLKRFKRLTLGSPIIMGRKTFESIGKPLPGRTSLVITRNPSFAVAGVITCTSLEDAVEKAGGFGTEEAFVIGGGEIYAMATAIADRIYLTRVNDFQDGDAFFRFDEEDWKVTDRSFHPKDEKHASSFEFIDLERI
ncbi:type 3 dihydrofolate reductase [Ravibacter arvi]|uniref:Dihydrofolate reductase n=1 Tax=Ravibacter arvi TaxID=2051041 RepID=A0ABP8LPI0_9BACT